MGRQITLAEMIKECEDEQKNNTKTTEIPADDAGKEDKPKVL